MPIMCLEEGVSHISPEPILKVFCCCSLNSRDVCPVPAMKQFKTHDYRKFTFYHHQVNHFPFLHPFYILIVHRIIQGSLNKFPDFFCMGTFIDSIHMKL